MDKLQVAGGQLRNPPVKFRHERWLHLAIDQHPVCPNRARRELWPRKWFLLGRNPWRYACRSIFSLCTCRSTQVKIYTGLLPSACLSILLHSDGSKYSVRIAKTLYWFDRINWPLTSRHVYFFGNACAGQVWHESCFVAYVCHRRPAGLPAISDLVNESGRKAINGIEQVCLWQSKTRVHVSLSKWNDFANIKKAVLAYCCHWAFGHHTFLHYNFGDFLFRFF